MIIMMILSLEVELSFFFTQVTSLRSNSTRTHTHTCLLSCYQKKKKKLTFESNFRTIITNYIDDVQKKQKKKKQGQKRVKFQIL